MKIQTFVNAVAGFKTLIQCVSKTIYIFFNFDQDHSFHHSHVRHIMIIQPNIIATFASMLKLISADETEVH